MQLLKQLLPYEYAQIYASYEQKYFYLKIKRLKLYFLLRNPLCGSTRAHFKKEKLHVFDPSAVFSPWPYCVARIRTLPPTVDVHG